MRNRWTTAALLSTVLIIGCGGDSASTTQYSQENQASAPPAAGGADAQRVSQAPVQRPAAATPKGEAAPRNETASSLADRTPPAASPVAPAPQWRELSLPTGTALPLEITATLSSETAQVETTVIARVQSAIVINGDTVIPAGAVLTGTVTDVERPGRVQGRAHLTMAFTQIRIGNDQNDLRASPITFEAEATKGDDAKKVGIGAAGGAIIGGILGGKGGAGKGAVAGAAAGTTVVLATRGKEIVVAEGTALTATLAQAFTRQIPLR